MRRLCNAIVTGARFVMVCYKKCEVPGLCLRGGGAIPYVCGIFGAIMSLVLSRQPHFNA